MERLTRADIKIGEWRESVGRLMRGTIHREDLAYRAAYVGECVLTGPEHAGLSDAALLDDAEAEAARQNLWVEDGDHE